MHRRHLLAGAAGTLLLVTTPGCSTQGSKPAERPAATFSESASSTPAPPSPPATDGKATAADYAALVSSGTLGEVYAVAWAKGLSRAAAADRYGLRRRLGTFRWPQANWDDVPGVRKDEAAVAITHVKGWALILTTYPAASSEEALLKRLSQGTRAVLNYHNFEADDRFVLADDGTIQADFDPGAATERSGTRPDMLLNDMRFAGLDLTGIDLDPADPSYRYVPDDQAALALTERVTSIRLTAHLLHTSTYLVGVVSSPSRGTVLDQVEELRSTGP